MSGEKRSQDREDTLLAETIIVVDIEGTTTSISFVKETLFPYVRNNLKQYIEKNWDTEEFKADLEKLKEQAKKDETDKVEGVVSISGGTAEEERESVAKNVLWQMDGDRKTGALKQLQGHMWREAYKSGAVKGHIYEDVPKAFDSWTKAGKKIYVYSSGSVEAQKLLFGHSEHGDLLKYFSGYFDTEVGPKQETASYKKILAKVEAEPTNVLFLTDIVKEAQAAKEAGLSTNIVIRPGNAPLTDEEKIKFSTIESFLDLAFEISAKRQKVEESEDKKKTETSVTTSEPMDTSEDVVTTGDKVTEKVDESKKIVEAEKTEEEKKNVEKSEVSGMDVVSKAETETTTVETADKTPRDQEVKKSEEQSKTSDKNQVDEQAAKVESVKEASGAKESEPSKSETAKDSSEPMDVGKPEAPSKSETIATITETEKTDTSSNKSAEPKAAETVAKVEESVKEEKPPKDDVKKAESEAPSAVEGSSSVTVESKVEETCDEKEKSTTTTAEKVEKEVVQSATEKEAPAKVEEKPVVQEVKQNGDSATAKTEETSAAPKTETNGDDKEEIAKKEQVTATETKAPTAPETDKKPEIAAVDNTKKEDIEAEKSKPDEAAATTVASATATAAATADESGDAKLNGNAQNGEKVSSGTEEKPHTNGLNDESSTEKSNGKTKEEASAAQNGEAECSSEAATESIKVKKVVDSTVADGAGEPDVVPPVAVAATS